MLWLCHAALVGMARQVIGVLVIVVLFSISSATSFPSDVETTLGSVVSPSWRFASPYLAASFVIIAFGIALTSGLNVNLAADRIALATGKARLRRPKQLLMGLSVQFGLGSILASVLALRTPCEIASIMRCFSNPIFDLVWAAALSVIVAGCGANAHALAKASTIIARPK
jgi:hypothetical protein